MGLTLKHQNSTLYYKNFLAEQGKQLSKKDFEASVKRAKQDKELTEKIARGDLKVVVLADNRKDGVSSELAIDLKNEIQDLGFRCTLGSDYYERLVECFDEEVEEEIGNHDLIVLINGKRAATIGESKNARKTIEWKKKTLFFFEYGDCEELLEYATKKKFPIDFKFPIPYRGEAELKAKVLFGVLHWHYYKYRKKKAEDKKESSNVQAKS